MFHLKEEIERKKAEVFLQKYGSGIISYEFTPVGSYDPIDLYFTGKTGTYSAEIKVRDSHIDQYPDYLIQEDKFQALKREHDKGRTALYINFFADGSYIIFNISERIKRGVDLRFRMMDLPASSLKEENREKLVTGLLIRDYDGLVYSGLDLETYLYQRELEILKMIN